MPGGRPPCYERLVLQRIELLYSHRTHHRPKLRHGFPRLIPNSRAWGRLWVELSEQLWVWPAVLNGVQPGGFAGGIDAEQHAGGNAEKMRLADIGPKLQFDDAINIQFTSGTTGHPKGATLSHHNILNNGYFVAEGLKLTPDDRRRGQRRQPLRA